MTQKDKERAIAALEEYKGDSTGLIAATVEDCQKVVREMAADEGWIPVSERLPALHLDDYKELDGSRMQFEVSDDQLVITASGCQKKARYETGPVFQGWVGDYGQTIRDVTHWMPLPEPPKEDA